MALNAHVMLVLCASVYADPRYWKMELYPSGGQNIICDGSAALRWED